MHFGRWKGLLVFATLSIGCTRYRDDVEYDHTVEYSWSEPGMTGDFTLFEGVRWDPSIVQTLRPQMTDQSLVANRKVLDLFGGPGVIAIACASESPSSVLTVAESKIAAACSRYNVAAHNQDLVVTVRLVDWNASPAVPSTEKFDVILATLLADDSESDQDSLNRRIAILLECFDGNLELSGRTFAACQNEDVAKQLQAAAAKAALSVVDSSTDTSPAPVFEIKRVATSTGQPTGAVSKEKTENL
jgi:hypothetical protein